MPVIADLSHAVIATGVAEARTRNWPIAIAVLDFDGNPVMFERMDGAQLAAIPISQKMALASVPLRRETKVAEANIQASNLYLLTLDLIVASRGGIPLVLDGKVIGANGVSGGTGAQNEVMAQAAIAALK